MNILLTPIAGAVIIETQTVKDSRGEFTRLYCERTLSDVLAGRRVVQANHSLTHAQGAIRGLHYQSPPHAEIKLVRCVKGKVWDVVVDLRKNSPTFLRWHAETLSPGTKTMVIPEGCAHGFQTLEPECELLYLHTAAYHPEVEGGLAYDDPAVSITWPLPPKELSTRDSNYPPIGNAFEGLAL
ncbi:MAG: dTDP-4-dehydrorhamnose 3,5-epimerase [Alphaproteobacteria bacterium]|nr:dTDP-4-dehydrorhamnose 3,5-epimerase [Alphaproteobacteria bacterium]